MPQSSGSKPEPASQSPGGLVMTQAAGPTPGFLIPKAGLGPGDAAAAVGTPLQGPWP